MLALNSRCALYTSFVVFLFFLFPCIKQHVVQEQDTCMFIYSHNTIKIYVRTRVTKTCVSVYIYEKKKKKYHEKPIRYPKTMFSAPEELLLFFFFCQTIHTRANDDSVAFYDMLICSTILWSFSEINRSSRFLIGLQQKTMLVVGKRGFQDYLIASSTSLPRCIAQNYRW